MTWRTDATRPGFTHPDDRPTRGELEADDQTDPFAGTIGCPHHCGARFHGESVAYWRHILDATNAGACPDPWTRSGW